MGFTAAFRAAIRPLNVRADLAALPWIATHTHALWVPLAITLASTVAIIATNGGDISLFMFAYFIQTPAIGGVFIAGFLAPRASWLLGAIVGLFSAVCYSLLVLAYPTTISAAAPTTVAGPGDRPLGVHPVAGHRGLLRGRRRLVPALPSAVEPEPRAPGAEVEREEDGRRSNPGRHDGEGKRQALIDSGAVSG